ncbi:MAG: phosphatase PAP2 family protein [Ignavibacteriota bacterium]
MPARCKITGTAVSRAVPADGFSSFPSGHSINTWAMASIVAHQYPRPRFVPVIAYGLATVVVVSRVGARQHFPGDVLAGSAMGWFLGDYVYGRRHNSELDPKPPAAQRLLDRVHFGMSHAVMAPSYEDEATCRLSITRTTLGTLFAAASALVLVTWESTCPASVTTPLVELTDILVTVDRPISR